MSHEADDLTEHVRAALAGDKSAARALLLAVQDDVYGLALRMLGHPADAEDAAQEILIIALTHLASFRAESSFKTWLWRIAVNHLARAKRGRRETLSFEDLGERLQTGLRDAAPGPDPEANALTRELRLRCTEAMLLSLDRELRVAYILGDILNLSGDEAAAVLELEPDAYRKRLSRARTRLYDFMRGWCGVFDARNPCGCAGQVDAAVERGLIAAEDLYLSARRKQPLRPELDRATREVSDLMRVAEVIRGPAEYGAPESLQQSLRALLTADGLELLRH
jgi:RNA polymerase sigma factor (sigma-70 family)